MDQIGEFLKVYPLNVDPSTWNRGEPRRPLTEYPSSRFPSSGFTPINQSTGQPSSVQPNQFSRNSPAETSFRPPSLRPLSPDSPETLHLSDTWHDMPAPAGKMITRAKAANMANQAIKTEILSPDEFPPAPIRSTNSKSSMPRMPVLVDAREEEFRVKQGKIGGKIQKGRQRSPGPLSSHAVYARMNRERKKKYLQELEEYKQVMTRKSRESKKELEQIHKETASLTEEIAALRSELVGNGALMSLLTMGRQEK